MTDDKILAFRYDGVSFDFAIGGDETIISETIEASGVWEKNQLSLYEGLIPDDGLFLDVGANVGINSLYAKAKRPNARVIAIEPEPRNFGRLSRNCANSGVEIHQMAIADHHGTIGFAGTGTNAHIAAAGELQVPCDTLDSFSVGLGLGEIDLLKIDVEGYTDIVLEHGGETLSRTRVAIVEFSHGDILSRLHTLDRPPSQALQHSDELFDRLRSAFPFFYYISRHDGLVELERTSDLFEIMFSEARVGDILASREPQTAITALGFGFRNILELKRQNHLRMMQIDDLVTIIKRSV